MVQKIAHMPNEIIYTKRAFSNRTSYVSCPISQVLILKQLYIIMSKNLEFMVVANTIGAVHTVVPIRTLAGVKQ